MVSMKVLKTSNLDMPTCGVVMIVAVNTDQRSLSRKENRWLEESDNHAAHSISASLHLTCTKEKATIHHRDNSASANVVAIAICFLVKLVDVVASLAHLCSSTFWITGRQR